MNTQWEFLEMNRGTVLQALVVREGSKLVRTAVTKELIMSSSQAVKQTNMHFIKSSVISNLIRTRHSSKLQYLFFF